VQVVARPLETQLGSAAWAGAAPMSARPKAGVSVASVSADAVPRLRQRLREGWTVCTVILLDFGLTASNLYGVSAEITGLSGR
jgi:hypothetical protein